ncbi:NADPH-dependent FMN reductase [Planomonospora parontospora]|uniref:NADPH-dependent FMN reductase n=1 Tax=Planomonospora parontospora TaxID=58119 RepID=UPI00166FBBBC|nr:NAD(P)H-dependent oxidoreductase [Planomonospora parontospora]GGL27769.1 FMN reductase [Planomonospora parontospora subsp. antibiotica]GII16482.1 FMN reductase [Planomonospora parontospora subsp. antibiotica]
MLDIAVINAADPESRSGANVLRWFLGQAGRRDDLRLDVVDLGRTPLPAPSAPRAGAGTREARELAARIGAADGFVMVTPEHNHAYPAVLKLAIDAVRREWAAKPAAFVSYGGQSGGLRAVEQLRLVLAELHVVTLRDTVSFHRVETRFGEHGEPLDRAGVDGAAKVLLDQLMWWGTALREARAARPYSV